MADRSRGMGSRIDMKIGSAKSSGIRQWQHFERVRVDSLASSFDKQRGLGRMMRYRVYHSRCRFSMLRIPTWFIIYYAGSNASTAFSMGAFLAERKSTYQ
ncbi:hypothetical protein LI328DRAFT_127914 [Trichoderma asperelloides]|nr:hypothetical protein LI328DRAFT_127914 [Trichoderma asperelloides]